MMVTAKMPTHHSPSLNHCPLTGRLGRPEPGKAYSAARPKKAPPAPTLRSKSFSNPPLGYHQTQFQSLRIISYPAWGNETQLVCAPDFEVSHDPFLGVLLVLE